MDRQFRLRGSKNFKRVRQQGTVSVHPLLVMVHTPNSLGRVRVGVAAGRSIGKAVKRNRAKRRLRAGIRPFLEHIQPGTDIVLLARRPILQAKFKQIIEAIADLLDDQHLIAKPSYETQTAPPRNPA